LSASGLAHPAEGHTYQAWFLTLTDPVSVTAFTPDASGRVSLTLPNPPGLPSLVTGAEITEEPAGGVGAPTGVSVLGQR
jgi:arginine/lysine/ornithine decarboxylase